MSADTTERAGEIERVRAAADRVARRMGKTFILNPEKVARFQPSSTAPTTTPEPDNVRWCPICRCKTWHIGPACEWNDMHAVIGPSRLPDRQDTVSPMSTTSDR